MLRKKVVTSRLANDQITNDGFKCVVYQLYTILVSDVIMRALVVY